MQQFFFFFICIVSKSERIICVVYIQIHIRRSMHLRTTFFCWKNEGGAVHKLMQKQMLRRKEDKYLHYWSPPKQSLPKKEIVSYQIDLLKLLLTDWWQHWVHAKSRSTKRTRFGMLHPTKITDMTQESGQEGIVAYCWAVAHNCYMFACSCYGNIHSPTIPKKANSSQSVWPDLKIERKNILHWYMKVQLKLAIMQQNIRWNLNSSTEISMKTILHCCAQSVGLRICEGTDSEKVHA